MKSIVLMKVVVLFSLAMNVYALDSVNEPNAMLYYKLPLSSNTATMWQSQRLGIAFHDQALQLDGTVSGLSTYRHNLPPLLDLSLLGDGKPELRVIGVNTLQPEYSNNLVEEGAIALFGVVAGVAVVYYAVKEIEEGIEEAIRCSSDEELVDGECVPVTSP